ncbi:uncharacterized protein K441DRAFT_572913, partial [Cenococcum geophilum 1.58]|uniref:uncharacterized protein n=1 Tax=Cenococcum geophilum 1.58 TaxID=794803 RepID=UPI0035902976
IAADGLYIALHGPYKGKVNDFFIVINSGVKGRLNKIFKDRHPYYLYGDQAYKSLTYIFGPYLS